MKKDKIRVGRSLRRGSNPVSQMIQELGNEIFKSLFRKISMVIANDQLKEMKNDLEKIRQGEGV